MANKIQVARAFVFDESNNAHEIDPTGVRVSASEMTAMDDADKAEAKYLDIQNKISRGEI